MGAGSNTEHCCVLGKRLEAIVKHNSRFGCGLFLAVNFLGFLALMFLAARAGMLFPADCGANVALEACARLHAEAQRPVMFALGVSVGANFTLMIVWFIRRAAR